MAKTGAKTLNTLRQLQAAFPGVEFRMDAGGEWERLCASCKTQSCALNSEHCAACEVQHTALLRAAMVSPTLLSTSDNEDDREHERDREHDREQDREHERDREQDTRGVRAKVTTRVIIRRYNGEQETRHIQSWSDLDAIASLDASPEVTGEKTVVSVSVPRCGGCVFAQPNQAAHMHAPDGCMAPDG